MKIPQENLINQIKCLEREIKMRKSFYPRLVAQNKMNKDKMNYEISMMEGALNSLKILFFSSIESS